MPTKIYDNIKNIRFIGDLSLEDASILALYGKKSKSIIEFGAGGSTQILSQCLPDKFVSVETSKYWIERTKSNLDKINIKTPPEFKDYGIYGEENYDLIFVDGIDDFRRDFAINHWKVLNFGGVMIFHDTRRFLDFQNVAWVAQLFYKEISRIDVNYENSNMTIIHKRDPLEYVNWNLNEGKPLWAYGIGEPEGGNGLWEIND